MPNCCAGQHVGSARAAADDRRARGQQAGLAAVGAARAEIHDLAALRGRHDARGLAGDHRLVAQRREQIGLHDLRFDDRRGDAHQRLAGKHQRAFGHGPNVAGEAEVREVVEKFAADVAEDGMLPQIGDFFAR